MYWYHWRQICSGLQSLLALYPVLWMLLKMARRLEQLWTQYNYICFHDVLPCPLYWKTKLSAYWVSSCVQSYYLRLQYLLHTVLSTFWKYEATMPPQQSPVHSLKVWGHHTSSSPVSCVQSYSLRPPCLLNSLLCTVLLSEATIPPPYCLVYSLKVWGYHASSTVSCTQS